MKKTRIMIVEDNQIVAEDIRQTLTGFGYHVTGMASGGKEALSIASEGKTDLVLMDVNLGGERDGIEIAAELKDRYNMPVVYLTAHSDMQTLERAKKTEPFGFLIKPFNE